MLPRLAEGKVAKVRVHVDARAAATELQGEERMAALEVECDRLVALGATRVRRHEPGWRYCVIDSRSWSTYPGTRPASRALP